LEIFGQKGIINSRLDDITKFAGMSNATFYNHFKDKDDLVSAVATSIALELVAAVEEQVVDIKDPAIRLVVSTNTVMSLLFSTRGGAMCWRQPFSWFRRG